MDTLRLPFHPLADLFPMMDEESGAALAKDIKEHGQHAAIVLYENKILDGRNRYRACLAAEVAPRFEQFSGTDPIAYVVSNNLHRRHLNESQRGMVAAKLANLMRGQRADLAHKNEDGEISSSSISGGAAAKLMNVNRSTVVNAKTVLASGTAEEIKAVESGHAAVSTIAKQIRKSVPAAKRVTKQSLSTTGRNPDRIEELRANARLWGLLRDALTNLTNLPRPTDVAAIVRSQDRAGVIDARLLAAINWLTEFSDAWTSPDAEANLGRKNKPARKAAENSAEGEAEGSATRESGAKPNGSGGADHPHAGEGRGIAGAQHAEPSA